MGRTERLHQTVYSDPRSQGYSAVPTGTGGPAPMSHGEDPPPASFFGKSNDFLGNLMPYGGFFNFITIISIIDVVMLIATLAVGASEYDGAFVKGNSMGGPSPRTLRAMGGKWEPSIYRGHVYLLLSPIILHSGIIHLVYNLIFQLRIGWVCEERWGWLRTAIVYVLSGVAGCLFSAWGSPNVVSVGASGALYGLMGASLAFLVYNWEVVPRNLWELITVGSVLVLNFVTSLFNPAIDNYAHLGGLLMGLALGSCVPPVYAMRTREKVIRGTAVFTSVVLLLVFCLIVWLGNGHMDH